ncbi:MAG: hypothetical protein HC809_03145 [Gammaproteobacteria bacterium]|nr:hypothetical protein [Gammaproteobacteria bacterium]
MRHYQEPVYRIAVPHRRDSDLAHKATRSTFVRAYRALPSYHYEVGPLPWLIRDRVLPDRVSGRLIASAAE